MNIIIICIILVIIGVIIVYLWNKKETYISYAKHKNTKCDDFNCGRRPPSGFVLT